MEISIKLAVLFDICDFVILNCIEMVLHNSGTQKVKGTFVAVHSLGATISSAPNSMTRFEGKNQMPGGNYGCVHPQLYTMM